MSKNIFVTIGFGLIVLALSPHGVASAGKRSEDKADPTVKGETVAEHVPAQLLIAFKDAASAQKRSQIFKKYSLTEKEKVGSTDLYLVQVNEDVPLDALIKKLTGEQGVKYAEPNLIMKIPTPVNE